MYSIQERISHSLRATHGYIAFCLCFQQKQLGDMEGEVKVIQMELAAIKQDRLDLHSQKYPSIYEVNV